MYNQNDEISILKQSYLVCLISAIKVHLAIKIITKYRIAIDVGIENFSR
jgi:hypothetical protein